MNDSSISPPTLHKLALDNPNVELIDVRTPIEFRSAHIHFSRNVPLDALDAAALAQRQDPDAPPLYVICQSGSRSRQASERLRAAGVANVVTVDGGAAAWEQAGLPLVRGKQAISLERQVRIAAGTLALLGALLAYLVHPAWIGLAGVVGAGLLLAGVTDWCGMALILAKAPWNQVSDCKSSTGATCQES